MFRIVLLVVALVLGIICGNQIGDKFDSGLVGFVGGFVCWVVFMFIAAIINTMVDGASRDISYRMRRRGTHGKSKYI